MQLVILAVFLFWASSAIAQDPTDVRTCFPPAPSTNVKTAEVIGCLSNVQKTIEAELNEKYQSSMSPLMLAPRMKGGLQKTQRLWTSYRDAVCKTQGDPKIEGGQIPISLCMIKITRERIADIEAFYTISR